MYNNLPEKDKIAFVFHGIVSGMSGRNGLGEPIDVINCSKTIKYNLLSQCDYDIFVHSWSTSFENTINDIYKPKLSQFEPQEYFGLLPHEITDHGTQGQSFRTRSRYLSLEKSNNLKKEYEIKNNFRYKLTMALRFDLVFFNKINFKLFNPDFMYLCSEPHWDFEKSSVFHDILFLSSDENINTYSELSNDFSNNRYNPGDAHHATYCKLMNMFSNDRNKIKIGFKRYEDVEIYRMIIDTSQNVVGHAYGALDTKERLNKQLIKINEEWKEGN